MILRLRPLDRWAVRAQQQACRNARAAATQAAQRRVERLEVESYVASLAPTAAPDTAVRRTAT